MTKRANETRARKAHVWARASDEWYVEPTEATKSLLRVERFAGPIHDPSCGKGNIVKTLIAAGFDATGSDIVRRVGPRCPWFTGRRDFLKARPTFRFQNIMCNPPFGRAVTAEEFVRKAWEVVDGKIAIFVEARFLFSEGRALGLYSEFPPHRIWYQTPRLSCPPGVYIDAGGKVGGGQADHVWLIWDMTAPQVEFPASGWLRPELEEAA